MIFTSIAYFILLAVTLVALAVIKNLKVQKWLLLGVSYFFYSRWDYRFVALLIGLTVATFVLVGFMERANDERSRKRWLAASIAVSLGTLCYFKYLNFFIGSFSSLLGRSGSSLPVLQIVLPVGISFIVFEVISYAVDVFRRDAEYEKDFVDFSILVAFFPHLVAGPILKPNDFLPQLRNPIRITSSGLSSGAQLFMIGLAKKVLIANRVSPFVDEIFRLPSSFSTITIWTAVLAYALQIYADFSGYTDMAIGSARMLGFTIPQNFDLPYLSTNITMFWRRWHISLSTWLKNYLYIPLGGSRKGRNRTYINLAVVMLLGGLWHGASWNFVLWGGLHGVGLAAHKLFLDQRKPEIAIRGPKLFFSWLLTFLFVVSAWVPFRSVNWATTVTLLTRMYVWQKDVLVDWNSNCLLYALPVLALCDVCSRGWQKGYRLDLTRFSHQFAFFLSGFMILALSPTTSSPFIYSQF